jgi:hypothetical protein
MLSRASQREILGKIAGTFLLYSSYSFPNSNVNVSSSKEIIKEYCIKKNEKVVATISHTFADPAIKTMPTYINVLPR